MNRRLEGADHSLNAPLRVGQRHRVAGLAGRREREPGDRARRGRRARPPRRRCCSAAMHVLNERERHILTERRLKEEPTTLEDLAAQYGISPRAGAPDRGARVREAAEGDQGARGRAGGKRRRGAATAGGGAALRLSAPANRRRPDRTVACCSPRAIPIAGSQEQPLPSAYSRRCDRRRRRGPTPERGGQPAAARGALVGVPDRTVVCCSPRAIPIAGSQEQPLPSAYSRRCDRQRRRGPTPEPAGQTGSGPDHPSPAGVPDRPVVCCSARAIPIAGSQPRPFSSTIAAQRPPHARAA